MMKRRLSRQNLLKNNHIVNSSKKNNSYITNKINNQNKNADVRTDKK